MGFSVLDSRETWNRRFQEFSPSLRDIYFSWEYHHLDRLTSAGFPRAAFFSTPAGAKILYPFFLKPISKFPSEEGFFDISSAYGFGGPLTEKTSPEDGRLFEEAFFEWCIQNRIVSEFVRFHPLLKNQEFFRRSIRVEENRRTVLVQLDRGPDSLWRNNISGKTRNMIRKGMKAGLEFRRTSDDAAFRELYLASMARVHADRFYVFPEAYFEELKTFDRECVAYFEGLLQGRVLAAAVFFISGERLYYHLSGSDWNFRRCAPNDFLLFKVIEWACRKGLRVLHLGGGTTADSHDRLFHFKKGFSPEEGVFFIGKRVHNPQQYDRFMQLWRCNTGAEPRLFQQYNA